MFNWFRTKAKIPLKEAFPQKKEFFLDPSGIFDYFTSLTGINFYHKEEITASKLVFFCRNHEIFSYDELLHQVEEDEHIREALINFLTVNETFFFREMRQIEFLTKIASDHFGKLRILCAPGSSGEEPFSIAMSLLERGVSASKIDIVSIDINSEAIRLAKRGEYSERSLYATDLNLRERYFDCIGDKYAVKSQLKHLVQFKVCNLFEEKLFTLGSFDIIFSRNMFIYFDEKTVMCAIERLIRLSKSDETLFFFGHADLLRAPPSLQEYYSNGIKYYKKSKECL